MLRIVLVVCLALIAQDAEAYIGPGAGIGLLGSLWAWLVGFVVVLGAILFWPIRWAWRRMRKGAGSSSTGSDPKA